MSRHLRVDGSAPMMAGESTPQTHTHRTRLAAASVVGVSIVSVGLFGAFASALSPSPSTSNTTLIASDSYSRTVTSGLGSATQGGAYTLTGAGKYSVSGGRAVMAGLKPGQSVHAVLASVSAVSTEVEDSLTLPSVANAERGLFYGLEARWSTNNSGYRGKVALDSGGHVLLRVSRVVTGAETQIAAATLPTVIASGQTVDLRMRVTGTAPVIVQFKAWRDGTTEPAWQVRYDDSSSAAIKSAGAIGTWAYVSSSGVTTAYSQANLRAWHVTSATSPVIPPPVAPPVVPPAPINTGKPIASTTGVPAGTKLTVYNGDLVITTAGATYSGLDIRGFVTVKAPNVTIKNSIVRGGVATSDIGLINDISSAGTNLHVTDSELVPQYPSVKIDGMKGSNYTATRLNIHGTVDGAKVIGDNDTIQDSYIHDLVLYSYDPDQNGPTHNDGVQVLGGRHTRILNNNFVIATNEKTAMEIGQSDGSVSDLQFNGNSVDGAICAVNVTNAPLASMSGITVNDNVFGPNTNPACTIIFKPAVSYTAIGNMMTPTDVVARVRVL